MFFPALSALLLKLSDALQEWERPSGKNQDGLPASAFSIDMEKSGSLDKLVLTADISNNRIDEIRREVYSTLIAPDIEIRPKTRI